MPFIIVYGIARKMDVDDLYLLRRAIVKTVADNMKLARHMVIPLFPTDALEEPKRGDEGGTTVYASIDTSFFGVLDEEGKIIAQNTLFALADVIWTALKKKYGVDVFVSPLSNILNCHKEA